jgi:thiol-disulfide isomerase/thioredoxin
LLLMTCLLRETFEKARADIFAYALMFKSRLSMLNRNQKLLLVAAACLIIGLVTLAAVYGIWPRQGNHSAMRSLPEASRGVAAFEWLDRPMKPQESVKFLDVDGQMISLDDFRGKVILLNLWASWCPPCLRELPSLDRLAVRFPGDKFAVVAVNLDRAGSRGAHEDPQTLYRRLAITHLAFYRDPQGLLGFALGTPGLPASLLFDAEGRELGMLAGDADWDGAAARALVAAAIEGKDFRNADREP